MMPAAAPNMEPIYRLGANMPPLPPEPTVNDVATILATPSSRMIPSEYWPIVTCPISL